MATVRGRFTGDYSVVRHGFVYEYDCARCRRIFLETCPDIEEPILCAKCFSGQSIQNEAIKKRRKYYEQKNQQAKKATRDSEQPGEQTSRDVSQGDSGTDRLSKDSPHFVRTR